MKQVIVLLMCSISVGSFAKLNKSEARNYFCDADRFKEFSRHEVELVKVHDGDTVTVKFDVKIRNRHQQIERKIRFLGIDTPETSYPVRGRSHTQDRNADGRKYQKNWGEEAKAKLKDILREQGKLEIEFGPTPCGIYGRSLGYLIKDGKNVNLELVREGLAATFCVYPALAKCNEFSQAAREATTEKKGYHQETDFELPYDFRSRLSGRDEAVHVVPVRTVHPFKNRDKVAPEDRVFFLENLQPKK